jgi:hypothetical protein
VFAVESTGLAGVAKSLRAMPVSKSFGPRPAHTPYGAPTPARSIMRLCPAVVVNALLKRGIGNWMPKSSPSRHRFDDEREQAAPQRTEHKHDGADR